MEICILASGSKGNAIYIRAGGRSFLVDLGLSVRELTRRSKSVGIDLAQISDCLITHEHTDHIKGVKTFAKNSSCAVWASEKTWAMLPEIDNRNGLMPEEPIFIGEAKITPIPISHDARSPLSFLIEDEKSKALILTDTGKRPQSLDKYIKNLDMVVLEANHNVGMLQKGPYP
ncbi:MAG TPA: MBL fold metallo-hydrolase, partial [Firmicutes bacterium]|nr:MBL fold metallo-hydrolase [Bacillota bacterium]